jgi:uncharacterized membrane protein YoaK (UPF0700 family)
MNSCPHCKADPCLPLWRKLLLGPASSARCPVCGYRVGVDVARACLMMLSSLLPVMAAAGGMLRDPVALVTLLLLCLIFMFALYAFWVPLKPDELTNATMVAAGRARIAAQKQAAGKSGSSAAVG